MCHPAWAPAHAPAWAPAHAPARYPYELVRVRQVRDRLDRDRARTVPAAHDGARRLPLDVAALAACSGIPPAQLTREFTRAYGVSPEEYASAARPEEPSAQPSVQPSVQGLRGEEMPCASVVAPAFSTVL
jgi:hypothetical protein